MKTSGRSSARCPLSSSLNGLVQRRDERLELRCSQELDLVEQEDDPRLVVSGRLAQRDEDVRQIVCKVPAVGLTFDGVEIEPGRPGAVGGDRQRERLEHSGGAARTLLPASAGRDLQEGPARQQRDALAEHSLSRDLSLDRDPPGRLGRRSELAEQDRLADTAKPGDHHGLLGMAAAQTCQKKVEAGELLVAPDEQRRPRASVRSIGVLARVHDQTLRRLRWFIKG